MGVKRRIPLGHRGEKNINTITIDYSAWTTAYGSGLLKAYHQRNDETTKYLLTLTTDSQGRAVWTISDADTGIEGFGSLELQYVVGTQLAKSDIFVTYTSRAMTDSTSTTPIPASGSLVPNGGTTGQVLKKSSATDGDTEWGDAGGSGLPTATVVGSAAIYNGSNWGVQEGYPYECHKPIVDVTVTGSGSGSTVWYVLGAYDELVEGQCYDVVFDGTTYSNIECIKHSGVGRYLGEISGETPVFDTYPFIILTDMPEFGWYAVMPTTGEHSFKISLHAAYDADVVCDEEDDDLWYGEVGITVPLELGHKYKVGFNSTTLKTYTATQNTSGPIYIQDDTTDLTLFSNAQGIFLQASAQGTYHIAFDVMDYETIYPEYIPDTAQYPLILYTSISTQAVALDTITLTDYQGDYYTGFELNEQFSAGRQIFILDRTSNKMYAYAKRGLLSESDTNGYTFICHDGSMNPYINITFNDDRTYKVRVFGNYPYETRFRFTTLPTSCATSAMRTGYWLDTGFLAQFIGETNSTYTKGAWYICTATTTSTGRTYTWTKLQTEWSDISNKPFSTVDSTTLTVSSDTLAVNTTSTAASGSNLPITSGGVYTLLGNVESLLANI